LTTTAATAAAATVAAHVRVGRATIQKTFPFSTNASTPAAPAPCETDALLGEAKPASSDASTGGLSVEEQSEVNHLKLRLATLDE
jgi:hypothetical protein